MKYFLNILLVFGFNFTFWSLVGILRVISEALRKLFYLWRVKNVPVLSRKNNLNENRVAVCMAAHNEEAVIESALEALKKIIGAEHIYVGSDASTDRTAELVRAHGANVLEITTNRGKAGALLAIINHFQLYNRYEFIVFVDADTRLRQDYLINALPFFENKKTAAVAGYARTQWKTNVFIAYRERIWFTLQTFFRFGMSSKFLNVNMIVPGFASIYRTRVLRCLDLARPGLVIEDYNLTFELHKKKLGLIAHSPTVTGYTEDPDNFKSYVKQISRWNLGFWQTVRVHGFWPSVFWLMLSLYLAEVILTGFVFLWLPVFMLGCLATVFLSLFSLVSASVLSLALIGLEWFVFVIALDFIYTLITSLMRNRPEMLFYSPLMLFFRWLDAYYLFAGLILSFKIKSTGAWQSPARWGNNGKTQNTINN